MVGRAGACSFARVQRDVNIFSVEQSPYDCGEDILGDEAR